MMSDVGSSSHTFAKNKKWYCVKKIELQCLKDVKNSHCCCLKRNNYPNSSRTHSEPPVSLEKYTSVCTFEERNSHDATIAKKKKLFSMLDLDEIKSHVKTYVSIDFFLNSIFGYYIYTVISLQTFLNTYKESINMYQYDTYIFIHYAIINLCINMIHIYLYIMFA